MRGKVFNTGGVIILTASTVCMHHNMAIISSEKAGRVDILSPGFRLLIVVKPILFKTGCTERHLQYSVALHACLLHDLEKQRF